MLHVFIAINYAVLDVTIYIIYTHKINVAMHVFVLVSPSWLSNNHQ